MTEENQRAYFSLGAVNTIFDIASKHIEEIFNHYEDDMAIRLTYAFLETVSAELISRAFTISDSGNFHEEFKKRVINTACLMRDIKLRIMDANRG